jgi:hypothetical protein
MCPAFQAAVDGGTSSASCASLACGYENQALRANYTDANHFQFSIFNFQLTGGREFRQECHAGSKQSAIRTP